MRSASYIIAVICLVGGYPARANAENVDGVVIVRFKPEHMPAPGNISPNGPAPWLGIAAIDAVLDQIGCYQLDRFIATFDQEPTDAGKRLERSFIVYYSSALDPLDLCAELEQHPYFESVTPNKKLRKYYGGTATFAPDDPEFDNQWNLHDADNDSSDIDAPEAWAIERGDPTVIIGIVDSGVMIDASNGGVSATSYRLHNDLQFYFNPDEDVDPENSVGSSDLDGIDGPDLDNELFLLLPDRADNVIGHTFTTPRTPDTSLHHFWRAMPHDWLYDPAADVWGALSHGTAVSSIAASVADNGNLIAGIANQCRIYAVRDGGDATSVVQETKAITMATIFCDVINMSWAFEEEPIGPDGQAFTDAIERAVLPPYDRVLISIAGNIDESGPNVGFPGSHSDVVAVGNMNPDRTLNHNSASGPDEGLVTLVAPVGEGGVRVASYHFDCNSFPCTFTEQPAWFTETSAAAPQVAGVAALIRSRFPNLNQEGVVARLTRGAEKYWAPTMENSIKFGAGKVNAYRSLTEWGSITSNVSWSAADTRDGKYYVSGDLTIENGATLTITAGTIVRIAPDHEELGADPDRVQIVVKAGGTLNVLGSSTSQGQVVFESFTDSSPTADDWIGIKFEAGSSGTIEHAVFKNAARAIENFAPIEITNCKFTDSATGIEAHANVTAIGSLIANNDVAVDIYSGTTTLTKCTLANNAISATVTRTGASLSLSKCVTSFNGGPAVRALSGGTSLASMSNSVVWDNGADSQSRTDDDWDVVGQNVYKLNPMFCNGPGGDYRLSAASPAVAPVPPSQGYFGERVGSFDIGCAPPTTIAPSVVARTCPGADAGVLEVIVDLDDVTRTIPADEFRLDIQDLVSIVFDPDGILPAIGSAGPSLYKASIVHGAFGARAGGPPPGCLCSHNDAADVLLNGYVLPAQASVTIRSPDLNGDGTVNVQDFAIFGYGGFPQDPVPAGDCRDFDGDGRKILQDYSFYGQHNGHTAQFPGQNVPSDFVQSNATVALQFTEEYPTATTHKLFVDVTLDNVSGVTTALFALAARSERLTFSEWREGESSIGTVIVAPIARDGEEQHYFGLLVSEQFTRPSAPLGQLVFDVDGTEPFEVIENQFALVTGEVMLESASNEQFVAQMDGGVTLTFDPATARVYHNRLEQNFPNPFNPTTTLAFSIKSAGNVSVSIYDVAGRRVRELINERRERGAYNVVWDGKNDNGSAVSSGVYFYKLVTGSFTDTKKMTLLK